MNFTRQKIVTWTSLGVLLVLAWYLRSVLAYFLVALIVSFLGAPIMRFLDSKKVFSKYKLPRGLSALLVIVSFLLVIGLFLYLVLPPLAEQISTISAIPAEALNKSFGEPLNDLKIWAESLGVQTQNFTVDYFKNQIQDMLNFDNMSKFAGDVLSGVSSITGWIFIVTFISFFLLKEKYLFYRLLHILTPEKHEDRMQRIMRNLNQMLGRYFRSLLLQIFVFGTYVFIGLSICGEKYALTVAIFSGLVNLISYIGPLLGVSFALFFSILSHVGASFYGVILPEMSQVIIVYLIAIMLDNFISYPLIFSNSLKVHPLELFFVILAGAQLGGLGGMMIAAPLYTVIRIFAKETLSNYQVVKNITKNI